MNLLFKKSRMYFKKQKLFFSDTLETYQMVKIAEILSSSTILGKHVFLSGKQGTGKTYILQMIRDVSSLEEQLFQQKVKELFDKRTNSHVQKDTMSKDDLRGLFGGQQSLGTEEGTKREGGILQNIFGNSQEETEKIIFECQQEVSKIFSTFDKKELEHEIFKDVDENLKQLYVHIRQNYSNLLFSFIDLSLISDNLITLNKSLESNIKLSRAMSYKNKLIFLLDNLGIYGMKGGSAFGEIYQIIKTFSDNGVLFIISGKSSEKTSLVEQLKDEIQINEIILDKLENQISEEIIQTHEGLKRDAGLKQHIDREGNKFYITVNSLREKYSMSEPSFSNEIMSDLFNSFQKEKINSIQSSLGKLKLSDINLNSNQNFDLYGNIYKKYQENIYTAENKEKDIQEIKKVLIGQDQALEGSLNSIFLGKGFQKNPISVLMYLGPTGVGKSELAKQIAKYVFNDIKKVKIFQMNQFQDRHTVSRLTGSDPGYVGYEESKSNNLKSVMEEMKEGVILFDEIEKAHHSIYDFLMSIIGDGKMSMASGVTEGQEVSFKNFVIIFTSNEITSFDEFKSERTIGFQTTQNNDEELDLTDQLTKEKVIDRLKEKFRPEFLGRIDQFFLFNSLSDENLKTILKNYLNKRKEELKEGLRTGYSPFKESDIDSFLQFDDSELDNIIISANNTQLGARYAIKKCEEIIGEKMNFHFTGKTPVSSQYKIVDSEDSEEMIEKKKRRKDKEKEE